jgi:hypothetical protein
VKERRRGTTRRRLGIAAGGLIAVVLAVATIAWFLLDPGPLRRIVVTSSDSEPISAHPFWQLAIEEDGTYTYSTGAYKRHGRIAFAPFADRFRSIAEIRWDLPPSTGGQPGMYFWAVGTRRTVAPFAHGNRSDHSELRAFGAALHDAVVADLRRTDAPRIAALNGLDQLRSVEMRASGAMCGRCQWTIRIDASAHAYAHTDEPFNRPHSLEHAAPIPWRDLVSAFRRAQLGELDAQYRAGASDVAGISFKFVFPQHSYAIDAPDFQEWPRPLRRAYMAVMVQLEQARWSPPIDRQSLPEAATMRAWADRPG